jgi:hypothetical protein
MIDSSPDFLRRYTPIIISALQESHKQAVKFR